MNKDSLPTFSVDLVQHLDKSYPERCPNMKMTDREIWYYAGARSVVNNLLARVKEQEESNLDMALIK